MYGSFPVFGGGFSKAYICFQRHIYKVGGYPALANASLHLPMQGCIGGCKPAFTNVLLHSEMQPYMIGFRPANSLSRVFPR
jgi:hypothetical protein